MDTHLKRTLRRTKRLVHVPSWTSNITMNERIKWMYKAFPFFSTVLCYENLPACFFSKEVLLNLNPQAFYGKFNKQMLSWLKRILCYANHEENHDRRCWMPARPGFSSIPWIACSRTELLGSEWEETNASLRAEKIKMCWINILDHKCHSKKILSIGCQPESGYIILI